MNQLAPDADDKVNILLVDDQPGKLLSYELILKELGQNLLKASSAKAALELLLKNDVAVILVDVCMPDLDGFELASMIREHPRFKDTAIIFISAINVTELDSLKGYELGGVDYVPVPVVPGVLRAKVRVFVDLHLKTRALARINNELELRVAERTAQLEAAIVHQELLAREVDHRARNALAVIQSIVALTPADSADFASSVKGRIRAMAMAHNLLSESRWRGADLLTLAQEELSPYSQDGRIQISGIAVSIAPNIAQNLALALHELATNAAKYGALSCPGGSLVLAWRTVVDEMHIEWVEAGSANVAPPSRSGFGTKVVETSVRSQLGGSIERHWREDGLHCTIRLPMRHFTLADGAPEVPIDEYADETDFERLRSRRILIVEDEPLIAIVTSRIVADLDAVVLGPFATTDAARGELDGAIDAALLDVNIGGRMVYDFAAELKARGVAIIFVTGYHAGAIDERFSAAPVLTKPVERGDLAAALTRVLTPIAASGPTHAGAMARQRSKAAYGVKIAD
jgi:two-component sensor histidine kinase/two-component SAPR family response regulator